MNNNQFFSLTNVRKIFSWVPTLTGKGQSAVQASGDHFTGIGTIMAEIGSTSEHANELALPILTELYGLQQRVNSYVAQVTQARGSY